MSATDLARLFAPPPADGSQGLRYRQGTVVTFNPSTLENTVLVGQTVYANLPMLGVAEAISLVPGSVVGLLMIGESATTWAIVGRLVTPGSEDAQDAITLLSQRIVSDTVHDVGTINTTSFADLAGSPGPQVTVSVGASGRVLVILSAFMFVQADTVLSAAAWMSFAMSGANTATADDAFANGGTAQLQLNVNAADPSVNASVGMQCSSLSLQDNLTPGLTTFTAKYKSDVTTSDAGFGQRNLTVFVL